MRAEDLMSRKVRTCSPDDTLEDAARIMWEADVGCLPVLDENRQLVGMITDRDVCMAAYTQGVPLKDSKVQSAMSRRVLTCRPDAAMADIEVLMRQAQIRRVPVVDAAGSICGIVTLGDLARHVQESPFKQPLEAPGVTKTVAAIVEPRHAGNGQSRHA